MNWFRLLIKFILICATYYFINAPFIDDRVNFYMMVEWWPKLSGYLAQLIITLILVTALSNTIRVVKYGFLMLFLINSIAYLGYYEAVGTNLTFSDFSTLFQAKGMAGDAFWGYIDVLITVILIHIPFVLVYIWRPGKGFGIKGSLISVGIYILVIIAYSISLMNTQGRGLIGRPGFMLPTVQLIVYGYVNAQNSDVNEALQPRIRPELSTLEIDETEMNTVIMVIDESTNWDLIDLNYEGNVTPILKSLNADNIINYGKATSYANCSDLSNASIRKFVRYNEEEKDLLGTDQVYIWDVAKSAGFTPYLIDAQANGVGHNYFTQKELSEITVIPATGRSDFELIDLIAAQKKERPTEKQFYLVIKQGAHLPFYKAGIEEVFSPAMVNASLSKSSREEIINTYRNRAIFETNRFFEEAIEKLGYTNDTALIYTSDHGQSFRAPGEKSFHCDTRNPDIEEVVVPLLVIGPNFLIQHQTIQNIKENNAYKSHYYIPSLIMAALGYQDASIVEFSEYPNINKDKAGNHFVYDRAVPFFDAESKKKIVTDQELDNLTPQSER